MVHEGSRCVIFEAGGRYFLWDRDDDDKVHAIVRPVGLEKIIEAFTDGIWLEIEPVYRDGNPLG